MLSHFLKTLPLRISVVNVGKILKNHILGPEKILYNFVGGYPSHPKKNPLWKKFSPSPPKKYLFVPYLRLHSAQQRADSSLWVVQDTHREPAIIM